MIYLISITKNGSDFFQRQVPGVREEQPCADGKDVSRDNKTEVKFPPDFSLLEVLVFVAL